MAGRWWEGSVPCWGFNRSGHLGVMSSGVGEEKLRQKGFPKIFVKNNLIFFDAACMQVKLCRNPFFTKRLKFSLQIQPLRFLPVSYYCLSKSKTYFYSRLLQSSLFILHYIILLYAICFLNQQLFLTLLTFFTGNNLFHSFAIYYYFFVLFILRLSIKLKCLIHLID